MHLTAPIIIQKTPKSPQEYKFKIKDSNLQNNQTQKPKRHSASSKHQNLKILKQKTTNSRANFHISNANEKMSQIKLNYPGSQSQVHGTTSNLQKHTLQAPRTTTNVKLTPTTFSEKRSKGIEAKTHQSDSIAPYLTPRSTGPRQILKNTHPKAQKPHPKSKQHPKNPQTKRYKGIKIKVHFQTQEHGSRTLSTSTAPKQKCPDLQHPRNTPKTLPPRRHVQKTKISNSQHQSSQ